MSKKQPTRGFNPVRVLQKFAVSAFVICSFLAYAVHEHVANPDGAVSAVDRTPSAMSLPLPDTPQPAPTSPQAAPAPSQPTPTAPLTAPTAVVRAASPYRDGTFTGPQVDASWGWVQVQTVIQNGKIANVRFLRYPNDRRTSVMINTQVIPWLQTEAIQAQGANVDIISGATLTSEAFIESLQAALNTAKNQS
jgi:uncharacterized protein with FMN-binding domain